MANIYSLGNKLWIEIAEQLVLSCSPDDLAPAFTSISNVVQTCIHLHHVASDALYHLDAKRKSYALYWSCFTGNANTLRRTLYAGSDPNTRWLVAHNGSAVDMIADSELVGDGEMDILDDDDDDDDDFGFDVGFGYKRLESIPGRDLSKPLSKRDLCQTKGALGRMLYARAEDRLSTDVPDPTQRELLRDAHLMRDQFIEVPITTATFSMDSALHLAAYLGHVEVVEELLHNGADVNQVARSVGSSATSSNWLEHTITALDLAVRKSHAEVARVLLAHGARLGPVGLGHAQQDEDEKTGARYA